MVPFAASAVRIIKCFQYEHTEVYSQHKIVATFTRTHIHINARETHIVVVTK